MNAAAVLDCGDERSDSPLSRRQVLAPGISKQLGSMSKAATAQAPLPHSKTWRKIDGTLSFFANVPRLPLPFSLPLRRLGLVCGRRFLGQLAGFLGLVKCQPFAGFFSRGGLAVFGVDSAKEL